MSPKEKTPKSLIEAVRYFADEERCIQFVADLRWPDGVACPKCESKRVGWISTRKNWKCKDCKKQFGIKFGTIFEDSAVKLDKWLIAIWLIVNAKNGISSYELARSLDVTQKTAWFMLHRIRLALHRGSFTKPLEGEVEADETYIGGKARNMHKGRRKAKGRGAVGKAVVFGLLERHGEVRTKVVPDSKASSLWPEIEAHVKPGSYLYTDELRSYQGLVQDYKHKVINHAETYVKGRVHTNGMENFWSLVKRSINGTYVSVEPFHLFRYLDEQAFRFNSRHEKDGDRFQKAVELVKGKRLTHERLTRYAEQPG